MVFNISLVNLEASKFLVSFLDVFGFVSKIYGKLSNQLCFYLEHKKDPKLRTLHYWEVDWSGKIKNPLKNLRKEKLGEMLPSIEQKSKACLINKIKEGAKLMSSHPDLAEIYDLSKLIGKLAELVNGEQLQKDSVTFNKETKHCSDFDEVDLINVDALDNVDDWSDVLPSTAGVTFDGYLDLRDGALNQRRKHFRCLVEKNLEMMRYSDSRISVACLLEAMNNATSELNSTSYDCTYKSKTQCGGDNVASAQTSTPPRLDSLEKMNEPAAAVIKAKRSESFTVSRGDSRRIRTVDDADVVNKSNDLEVIFQPKKCPSYTCLVEEDYNDDLVSECDITLLENRLFHLPSVTPSNETFCLSNGSELMISAEVDSEKQVLQNDQRKKVTSKSKTRRSKFFQLRSFLPKPVKRQMPLLLKVNKLG